jgi:hypothetical protein
VRKRKRGRGGGGETHSAFVARLVETCTDDAARTDRLYAELEDRLRVHDYPAASRSMQALSVLATVNWLLQLMLKPPAQDAAAFATYMDTQRQFVASGDAWPLRHVRRISGR